MEDLVQLALFGILALLGAIVQRVSEARARRAAAAAAARAAAHPEGSAPRSEPEPRTPPPKKPARSGEPPRRAEPRPRRKPKGPKRPQPAAKPLAREEEPAPRHERVSGRIADRHLATATPGVELRHLGRAMPSAVDARHLTPLGESSTGPSARVARVDLLRWLRDGYGVRDAVVMREILGRPLADRHDDDR